MAASSDIPVAEGYSRAGEMKAVIVNLSGDVRIKNKGEKSWHGAKLNETVRTGDSIETMQNGKVEFKIENGNIITLQQDSNVTISRMSGDRLEFEKVGGSQTMRSQALPSRRAWVRKALTSAWT
ncbi:MAG TPA: hypothetical protein PKV09_11735, partial [Syntrophales bacterium]|nr:hypothetical protein [Syntrophales bacterium]